MPGRMLWCLLAMAVGAASLETCNRSASAASFSVTNGTRASLGFTAAGEAVLAVCIVPGGSTGSSGSINILDANTGALKQTTDLKCTADEEPVAISGQTVLAYRRDLSFLPLGGGDPKTANGTTNSLGYNGDGLIVAGFGVLAGSWHYAKVFNSTGTKLQEIKVDDLTLAVAVSKRVGPASSYYVAVATGNSIVIYNSDGSVVNTHTYPNSLYLDTLGLHFRESDLAVVACTAFRTTVYSLNTSEVTEVGTDEARVSHAVGFNDEGSRVISASSDEAPGMHTVWDRDLQTGGVRTLCSVDKSIRRVSLARDHQGRDWLAAYSAADPDTPMKVVLFQVPPSTEAPQTAAPPTPEPASPTETPSTPAPAASTTSAPPTAVPTRRGVRQTYAPGSDTPSESGGPLAIIVGATVGLVALLLGVGMGVWVWRKRYSPPDMSKILDFEASAIASRDDYSALSRI